MLKFLGNYIICFVFVMKKKMLKG